MEDGRSAYLSSALWSAPPTVKVAVEPLWLRVKGVSPAPRAATSERERVEVQRFDVLAVLVVLYELHQAQLVVFIHKVDDLVQQLFAVAASDDIVGVGAGGGQRY
ncbi:MAG: hypothetical protein ACLVBX_02715 [Faecalibacterium prausnitzii]